MIKDLSQEAILFPVKFEDATIKDLPAIKKIFKDAIEYCCLDDYSIEDISNWVSSANNEEFWNNLLQEGHVRVLYHKDEIIGYYVLKYNEVIEHLFVHKDFQRDGIGGILLYDVEEHLKSNNYNKLYAEVSRTALPFFKANKFEIVSTSVDVDPKYVAPFTPMRKFLL